MGAAVAAFVDLKADEAAADGTSLSGTPNTLNREAVEGVGGGFSAAAST